MSQAPVMPMFVDAMLGDTLHLDAELFGAYHFILYATWRANGQPMKDDDAVLARVCRMPLPRWRKVRPTLTPFFDLGDGHWRQKRLEQEWSSVQERAERSRKNGTKGGRPKVEKKKPKNIPAHNPDGNPTGNPAGTRRQSILIPSLIQVNPLPPKEEDAASRNAGTVGAARRDDDPVDALIRVLDDAVAEHFPVPRPGRHHQDRSIAAGWRDRGITPQQARDVIEPIVGRRAAEGQDAPQSLKFFIDPMLRAIAGAGPKAAAPPPADPETEAKAARFNAAVRSWSDDGRQGAPPTPEQFGLSPQGAARRSG